MQAHMAEHEILAKSETHPKSSLRTVNSQAPGNRPAVRPVLHAFKMTLDLRG